MRVTKLIKLHLKRETVCSVGVRSGVKGGGKSSIPSRYPGIQR
jgi:hypothetical protein